MGLKLHLSFNNFERKLGEWFTLEKIYKFTNSDSKRPPDKNRIFTLSGSEAQGNPMNNIRRPNVKEYTDLFFYL